MHGEIFHSQKKKKFLITFGGMPQYQHIMEPEICYQMLDQVLTYEEFLFLSIAENQTNISSKRPCLDWFFNDWRGAGKTTDQLPLYNLIVLSKN